MSVKYDLGTRTRTAYEKKDKAALTALVVDYQKTEELLEKFYSAFQKLWFTENKPHGFEVQNLRLGGLAQRLKSYKVRLARYLNGEEDVLVELEEELLDIYGFVKNFEKQKTLTDNWWNTIATVNEVL